ncbi:MAG: type II toxin-antitoxin system HicA family toxin [Bacteroidota bacterium]|nr:type II toxin-antitoxin system HicA family toxin [Bacteroidota bacterium]MDX5506718.1 type II toxin-antitoxin system HicA family toxin [Bacteroidota bacterium]
MSKIEKLIDRLQSKPRDFTWSELKRVLKYFGYVERKGKGSRRKFIHQDGTTIILHEPHPKPVLKIYMIELVLQHLNLAEDE